jgi:2'-5' RNA ligase
MNKNSNNFRGMYAELGINIDKLGCIMLDIDGANIPKHVDESVLYFTSNPDRTWIKGFVAGKVPHVTLLYGLLESGQKNKEYVDQVLNGWSIEAVEVDHVGFFESPYEDDPYYCIIAHLKITDNLLEGHKRLEFLPHINTFPDYKAHITIAYVKKDEAVRDEVINQYNKFFYDNPLMTVKQINYGK